LANEDLTPTSGRNLWPWVVLRKISFDPSESVHPTPHVPDYSRTRGPVLH
jgi:hypothetical protein